MANTQQESAIGRLIKKLRAELAIPEPVERDLPRAPYYDDLLIVDVLENRQLSLAARCLLAFMLTRQDRLTLSHRASEIIGSDDRVSVNAAVRELQSKGYARDTSPNRWDFYAVPVGASKP